VTLTLRARLAGVSTLVFALLMGSLAVTSYRVFASQLDADTTSRLTELTDGLHGYLQFDLDVPSVVFDARDEDAATFVHDATRYYQIYDVEHGRLIVQSEGMAPLGLRLTAQEVTAYRQTADPFDVETEYGRLRISNSVVASPGGHEYLLQVGVPLRQVDASVTRYRDLLLIGVPLSVLVSGVASWWLSGFALAPLVRFAHAARGIDVTTLGRRMPSRGANDELDQVAHAFNDTLARLEHAVAEMRQFSTALAHELRTPLAALRGEIEIALGRLNAADPHRDVLGSQIEELDRLTRLIGEILTLARAESGEIRLTFAAVDLSALSQLLVEQLETVADARGVTLRCEQSGPVIVQGDESWLRRLLINLIDNALKFTPAGGQVIVGVSQTGDHASVEVSDTGPGMSSEDAQRVFERFFRADPSRTSATEGVGLGLSLVQWIVERHGGSVSVETELGHGATFGVVLPKDG
jgi:heavy metal sensor kinase